jgi:hypothetical protein
MELLLPPRMGLKPRRREIKADPLELTPTWSEAVRRLERTLAETRENQHRHRRLTREEPKSLERGPAATERAEEKSARD